MELGATDFLTKPYSPKRLYARASELVGLPPDERPEESA
jgi:DNA-binding response OmpR family regulator